MTKYFQVRIKYFQVRIKYFQVRIKYFQFRIKYFQVRIKYFQVRIKYFQVRIKYFQVRITALEYSGYFIIFGSLNLSFLQSLRFLEDAPKLIYVAVNSKTPCNNDWRGNVNNNPGQ
jgi:hypothetical protein